MNVEDLWTIRNPPDWFVFRNRYIVASGPVSVTLHVAIRPEQTTVEFEVAFVFGKNPDEPIRTRRVLFSVDRENHRLVQIGTP